MQIKHRPLCDEPPCKQTAIMFMSNPEGGSTYLCWQHYAESRNVKTIIDLKLEKKEASEEESLSSV